MQSIVVLIKTSSTPSNDMQLTLALLPLLQPTTTTTPSTTSSWCHSSAVDLDWIEQRICHSLCENFLHLGDPTTSASIAFNPTPHCPVNFDTIECTIHHSLYKLYPLDDMQHTLTPLLPLSTTLSCCPPPLLTLTRLNKTFISASVMIFSI